MFIEITEKVRRRVKAAIHRSCASYTLVQPGRKVSATDLLNQDDFVDYDLDRRIFMQIAYRHNRTTLLPKEQHLLNERLEDIKKDIQSNTGQLPIEFDFFVAHEMVRTAIKEQEGY